MDTLGSLALLITVLSVALGVPAWISHWRRTRSGR